MSPSNRFPSLLPFVGVLSALTFVPASAYGQMVTGSFPLVGARSSFSEGISINGGFRGSGVRSPFNNFGAGPRALGGVFGLNSGGFGANLGFNFSQGASRSMVSNTPLVTGFPGQPLSFQNSLQRPFVTSWIPNVGSAAFQDLGAANTIRGRMLRGEFRMENGKVVPAGGSNPGTALAETQNRVPHNRPLVDAAPPTRAEREALIEEKRAETQLAIRKYLQKGKDAEAKGKPGVAKVYYQRAARMAGGELKREALASLDRVAN